ncbi:MAG TPA: hypothetical protein VGI90_14725 [Steroidobacteraceae bacterium]|jgi:hypothetical protein
METRDNLLQATLGHDDSPATSIYSVRTGYLSSFFGGPLAGATVALANAYRLKRLGTDWPIGLLALAATIGPMWWWIHGGAKWLADYAGRDAQSVAFRVLGLGFFALVYGWHRRYYRNMAFFGLKPPSGWPIGIAAVIGGLAMNYALATVLT